MDAVSRDLKKYIGGWKGRVPILETNLNISEARLEGQEKELFLNFIRKILQWMPEDRFDFEDIFHGRMALGRSD